MKKTIMTIVIGMFLLLVVQAMYSGQTTYKDLTTEIENLQSFECNLTAENYNLDGSNFTTNETGYILSLDINFKPDNLTISCILNGEKFVEDKVRSSGGGGGGSCYTNYECTEWSRCNKGISERSCVGLKETCQGYKPFPETNKSCDVINDVVENEIIEVTIEPEVIEDKKVGWVMWLIIIVLAIIINLVILWLVI